MEIENLDNDYFSKFLRIGSKDYNEKRKFAILTPCRNSIKYEYREPLGYDYNTGDVIDNKGRISYGFVLPFLWNKTLYISNKDKEGKDITFNTLTKEYCRGVKEDYRILLDKIINNKTYGYDLEKENNRRNFFLENYNSIKVSILNNSLFTDNQKLFSFIKAINNYSYIKIIGIYGGEPEISFIVEDIPFDLTEDLSNRYFQDGFIYFDSLKKNKEFNYYCYSLKENKYKLTDSQSRFNFKPIEFEDINPLLFNEYKNASYEDVKDNNNTYASFIRPINGNGKFSIDFIDSAYYCEKVLEVVDKSKIQIEYSSYNYFIIPIYNTVIKLLDNKIAEYGISYKLLSDNNNPYSTLEDLARNIYLLFSNAYKYNSPIKIVDNLKNDYGYYCYIVYRNNNKNFDLDNPNMIMILDKEFVSSINLQNEINKENKIDRNINKKNKKEINDEDLALILDNALFSNLLNF